MLTLKLLTTEELMELLNVNHRWVDRQVAEGKLKFYKVGGLRRFLPSDVQEFVRLQNDGRALPLDGEDFIEDA